MKRSKSVSLILLGTAALLVGCDEDSARDQAETLQNTYYSQADCEADWGKDEGNCTPNTSPNLTSTATDTSANSDSTSSSNQSGLVNESSVQSSSYVSTPSHGSVYLGPRYYWDHSGGYPVIIHSNGTTSAAPASHVTSSGHSSNTTGSVSRGGFSRGGFGSTAHGFSSGG